MITNWEAKGDGKICGYACWIYDDTDPQIIAEMNKKYYFCRIKCIQA